MTTSMLNLPNIKILDMKESEYEYRFLVESATPSPSHCLTCGTLKNYTNSLNRLMKTMNHVGRGYSFEALRAKILFTQGYRKVKLKKKFKEVEATFGKMLPVQIPNWLKLDYEWGYEEIHGADFSTLIKAMKEGSF